ncbi:MAG: hypothetical protein ACLVKO_01840 [Dysgonomonas sp.]
MKKVDNKDKVNRELLDLYDSVDGYDVMKELMLCRGEDVICRDLRVQFKDLLDMALILYGLKVNSTNKLYISYSLNRFYKKEALVTPNGSIKVPVKIYDEVKTINDKYRNQ